MKTDFMGYDEASAYLGLKKNTLYSRVSLKQIPHIRLSGRLVLFSREALDRWLDAHRVDPDEPSRGR